MSLLKNLKKINNEKSLQLFKEHPLFNAEFEKRLRYFSGVAMATALERELNENEQQGFSALAKSLQIDDADANDILVERKNLDSYDTQRILDEIKNAGEEWAYLFDLTWIHCADRNIEQLELESTKELEWYLFGTNEKSKIILNFLQAVRVSNSREMLTNLMLFPSEIRQKIACGMFSKFGNLESVEIKVAGKNKVSGAFAGKPWLSAEQRLGSSHGYFIVKVGDYVNEGAELFKSTSYDSVSEREIKISSPADGVVADLIDHIGLAYCGESKKPAGCCGAWVTWENFDKATKIREGDVVGKLYRFAVDANGVN